MSCFKVLKVVMGTLVVACLSCGITLSLEADGDADYKSAVQELNIRLTRPD